jgi:translation elongation factor EF-1alpha
MGGNILFLSGTVDKRTMEKYEREAKEAGRETWYLSLVLDSTPQERSKGKLSKSAARTLRPRHGDTLSSTRRDTRRSCRR